MFEHDLIEAVQRHACLYDRHNIDYRNKLQRENAWLNVSEALGVDVRMCQGRWKTLRDRFVKEISPKPVHVITTQERQTKWKFMKYMEFLRGYLHHSRKGNSTPSTLRDDAYFSSPRSQESLLSYSPSACSQGTFFMDDMNPMTPLTPLTPLTPHAPALKQPKKRNFALEEDYEAQLEHHGVNSDYNGNTEELETLQSPLLKKQKVFNEKANEKFNVLVGTVTDLLEQQVKRSSESSKNSDFYKVLDSYLVKLPEEVQDEVKVDILSLVLNRKRSITSNNSKC